MPSATQRTVSFYWGNNAYWLSDFPLNSWKGVSTNVDGRVTQLRLANNALSGEIPPELGSLSNLQRLDLAGNQLSGEIPPELGSLSDLKWLHPRRQQVERGDTGGTGQPLQPDNAGPRLQRQKSGCVPSSLEDQLDLSNSDLGDLPFC